MKKNVIALAILMALMCCMFNLYADDIGRASEAASRADRELADLEEKINVELSEERNLADLFVHSAVHLAGAVVFRDRSGDMVYTCFYVDQGGNVHLDDTVSPFPPVDSDECYQAAVGEN